MNLKDVVTFYRSIGSLGEPSLFDTNFLVPTISSQIRKNGKRLITWNYLGEIQREMGKLYGLHHEKNFGLHPTELIEGKEYFSNLYFKVRELIEGAYFSLAELIANSENVLITEEVKDEHNRDVCNIESLLGETANEYSRERISFELKQKLKINNAFIEADNSDRVVFGHRNSLEIMLGNYLMQFAKWNRYDVSEDDVALVRRGIFRALEKEEEHVIYTHDKELYDFVDAINRDKGCFRIVRSRYFSDSLSLVRVYWTSWSFDQKSFRRSFSENNNGAIVMPSDFNLV